MEISSTVTVLIEVGPELSKLLWAALIVAATLAFALVVYKFRKGL